MATRRNRTQRKNRSQRKNRNQRQRKNRSQRQRKQQGGFYSPGELSLAQGRQYSELHSNQHGGGGYQMANPAGISDSTMALDGDMRLRAGVSGLDTKYAEVVGMSDTASAAPAAPAPQKGGRRKNRSQRKQRKNRSQRKQRKNRSQRTKGRKNRSQRQRKQQGGALTGAPYGGSSMLLTPFQAARAGTADFSNPLLRD